MAADQLPAEVGKFATYLDGLLARLDPSGGWCAVFWQRDPEGMRACLDGREMPPWDVVEALLQDLAGQYGPGGAGPETDRARALHAAALAAYDGRPGGRDALGDRLDVMLREQKYAAERQAALARHLTSATTREQADALRLDLAWARDDHERAVARCAELRARMAPLDRRDQEVLPRTWEDTAGPSTTGDGYEPGAPWAGTGAGGRYDAGGLKPGRRTPQHSTGLHAPEEAAAAAAGSDGLPARAAAVADAAGRYDAVAPEAGRPAPQYTESRTAPGEAAGSDGFPARAAAGTGAGGRYDAVGQAARRHAPQHPAGPAARGEGAAGGTSGGITAWGAAPAAPVLGAFAPAAGSTPAAPGSPAADSSWAAGPSTAGSTPAASGPPAADSSWAAGPSTAGSTPAASGPPAADSSWAAGPSTTGSAPAAPRPPTGDSSPAAGSPTTHPAPADPESPTPKQRKRRRGSARFAGMVDEGAAAVAVPPAAAVPDLPVPAPTAPGRTPRGARFAGAAEEAAVERAAPEAGRPGDADLDEVGRTVDLLARLRSEGRSGEAHALLTEVASWEPARFPLLAERLHRAGLDADWQTLLWEAASLPAGRLVAAADALIAAGRAGDGQQMLRQGVARPPGEVGAAVLGLAAEGRHREVRVLLDAYVRARTPEEAARSAAPDPRRLVPLLLEAARGVSDERSWDLVHALRVAGFAA
ncbi:hypothetical protein ACFZCT_03775 [Streptomyces qaidamensis]|uniref:hypothetical protein n=1 Tax=Streptomyces qaidamensis TaxID=1783515 RepID=UPI0036E40027